MEEALFRLIGRSKEEKKIIRKEKHCGKKYKKYDKNMKLDEKLQCMCVISMTDHFQSLSYCYRM